MSDTALVVLTAVATAAAVASGVAALLALRWARRSATASEKAASAADEQRKQANAPTFEVRAFETPTDGPSLEVRCMTHDLDRVVISILEEDRGLRGPAMSTGTNGAKDVGAMRAGETRRMQISRNGRVAGATVRLRVESWVGADSWVTAVADTFARRGVH